MNLQNQQNAQQALDQARLSLAAGLLDDAEQQIMHSIRHNSESTDARLTQAEILLCKNLPNQAMAALDAIDYLSSQAQSHPPIALARAKILIASNHFSLAEPLLCKLTENFPDDVRPRRLLAGLYLKRHQTNKAIPHLKKLHQLEPSNQTNARLLADLLQPTDPQQAIDILIQYPPTTLSIARIARLHHQLGNLRNAEEYYRQLLAVDPDDPNLYYDTARLARESGEIKIAIKRASLAIKYARSDQQHTEYQTFLAEIHTDAGDFHKAARCWFRILRRIPGHTHATTGLIVCALILNYHRLAARFKKQLAIQTSKNERRKLLSQAWHHAAAGKVIRQNRQNQPAITNPTPLQVILNQSVIKLSQSVEQAPEKADLHFHLSRCAHQLGQTEIADEALHQALSINPKYVRAARFRDARSVRNAA